MCYVLIEVNQRSSMATVSRLPITKARINLGQIARRAHNGNEYFILEKDGIPVIGIMAADELEDYLDCAIPRSRPRLRQAPRIGGREDPACQQATGRIEAERCKKDCIARPTHGRFRILSPHYRTF